MNTSFLHHGIKGQSWGVRNGPPYPLDRKIKKGTTAYRVAGQNDKVDSRIKYITTDIDEHFGYEEMFDMLDMDFHDTPYAYTYQATKDLKIANASKFVNMYKDVKLKDLLSEESNLYNKSYFKKLSDEDKNKVLNYKFDKAIKNDGRDEDFGDIINNKDYAANHFARQYFKETIKKEDIIKEFKKLGYDGIQDLEDLSIAKTATILFDPKESIKVTGKYAYGLKLSKNELESG